MPNVTSPKSRRYRGWFRDIGNNLLEAYHGTTRILGASATALTVDLASTFAAAVTFSGVATFNAAQVFNAAQRGGTTGIFGFGAAQAITIASDTIAPTKSFVVLDAEGAGTTDGLATITPWAGIIDGDLLLLKANATDTITVDDATINLGAATRALAPGGSLLLRYDGTEAEFTEVVFLAGADNV